MNFDIISFYNHHHIEYVTKGTNVKRSDVNISCPFCNSTSSPDPSHHLGVNLNTGQWSCWRDRRHRGRTLHRLIMKIAKVSYAQARELLGEDRVWINEGAFERFAEDPEGYFSGDAEEEEKARELELPKEFREFDGKRAAGPYWGYLAGRGFHPRHLEELVRRYYLRYAISGAFSSRIILPLHLDHQLMGWTSRAIAKDASLRYRTLSEDEGALVSVKELVFDFDNIVDYYGDVLFICEGPFDAIKLDFYARDLRSRATCVFGLNFKPSQLALLSELAFNFRRVVILLDREEYSSAWYLQGWLEDYTSNRIALGELPESVKDPGDLRQTQIYRLVKRYVDWRDD